MTEYTKHSCTQLNQTNCGNKSILHLFIRILTSVTPEHSFQGKGWRSSSAVDEAVSQTLSTCHYHGHGQGNILVQVLGRRQRTAVFKSNAVNLQILQVAVKCYSYLPYSLVCSDIFTGHISNILSMSLESRPRSEAVGLIPHFFREPQ